MCQIKRGGAGNSANGGKGRLFSKRLWFFALFVWFSSPILKGGMHSVNLARRMDSKSWGEIDTAGKDFDLLCHGLV